MCADLTNWRQGVFRFRLFEPTTRFDSLRCLPSSLPCFPVLHGSRLLAHSLSCHQSYPSLLLDLKGSDRPTPAIGGDTRLGGLCMGTQIRACTVDLPQFICQTVWQLSSVTDWQLRGSEIKMANDSSGSEAVCKQRQCEAPPSAWGRHRSTKIKTSKTALCWGGGCVPG